MSPLEYWTEGRSRLQFILDSKISSMLDYIERDGFPCAACSASNNDGGDCPMIRRLSVLIVTCTCLAAVGLAATGLAAQLRKPDFSGTWQVDPMRSSKETRLVTWVEPPPANAVFFSLVPERITHHEPYLVVVDAHGQRIRMTTDGKEKVNQLSGGFVHRSKTRCGRERAGYGVEHRAQRQDKRARHGPALPLSRRRGLDR